MASSNPMLSASGADLGVDSMTVIGGPSGGNLSDDLLQSVKDQEDERRRKLMQVGGTISLAAQSLLGNSSGGFGG